MNRIYDIYDDNSNCLYVVQLEKINAKFEEAILEKYFGKFACYDSDDNLIFHYNVDLCNDSNIQKDNQLKIDDIQMEFINVSYNDELIISFEKNDISNQIKRIILDKASELSREKLEGFEINDDEVNEDEIVKPYNAELIRVDNKQMQISYIHELINEYGNLELSADFQRHFIWNDARRKSRLIESILLRIPLPAFYFSTDKTGNYQIVDGIQRITVINMFINGEFKLTDLEYLEVECKDCFFSKKYDKSNSAAKSKRKYLNSKYVRRILETQLSINVIDPQTPTQVKYDIFKRLNTGGKPLNNMEIRNSFASNKTRSFFKKLVSNENYLQSSLTSVNNIRFADYELLLRFICFYKDRIKHDDRFSYKGNMEIYLDNAIEYLNNCNQGELIEIENAFIKMLKISKKLFGRYAFRKVFPKVTSGRYRIPLINKALFTSMSIVIVMYNNELENYEKPINSNVEKLADFIDHNYSYFESLTYGTNDRYRIDNVFSYTKDFICSLIERDNND